MDVSQYEQCISTEESNYLIDYFLYIEEAWKYLNPMFLQNYHKGRLLNVGYVLTLQDIEDIDFWNNQKKSFILINSKNVIVFP